MSFVYSWFEISHNSKFYLAVYTSKNSQNAAYFSPIQALGLLTKMAGKALQKERHFQDKNSRGIRVKVLSVCLLLRTCEPQHIISNKVAF